MLTAGDGPDPTSPTGAGRVLSLIRDGEAVTRADLARRTGLARSTVAQRVEALLAHQLVYRLGLQPGRRRRPRGRSGRDPLTAGGLGPWRYAARRARVQHRRGARSGGRAGVGRGSVRTARLV